MKFSIIVAASENGVIGDQGNMPWKKLPSDLAYFKQKTIGHWCILGRKTYAALGNKALPGRDFLILTRDTDFRSSDSEVVHTFDQALHYAQWENEEEVFVIGGGDVYRQFLPYCSRIYLTRIHEVFDGDTYFETPDLSNWLLMQKDERYIDEKNPYQHTFYVYERKPDFFE